MSFLKVLFRNLMAGPSTDPFPFGETFTPKKLRGRVVYDASKCTSCRTCEQVCIGGAIRFDNTPDGRRFLLWHDTCTFCGLCVFYCPQGALAMTDDWHLSHTQDEKFKLVEHGLMPKAKCAACGAEYVVVAPTAKAFAGYAPSADEVEALRQYCPRCRRKKAAEIAAAHPPQIAAEPDKGQSS
jgi:formate hydrogenlyase subunit 6/NADH:ubiquinone oxidoreductase subunit I